MDTSSAETSEFSLFEILYMGHAALTYHVEEVITSTTMSDPFDIIAELEERLGKPLAHFLGDTDVER